jgi:UDP-N-acetylmuramoylalanine--D-glutamate ligase
MAYAGQRVLVVGLGMSGASALRYLVTEGADVVVTDTRTAPAGIAALTAAFPNLEFRLGAFSAPQPLTQFTLAVVSPGVSLDEPFVRELAAAGVEIVGDIELFARSARAPVVGITGSNGKSTVTTLVGEMAREAGARVAVGGNLGTPALDLLDDAIELYVLELSSFQLETTQHLHCVAATVLNLSQDHLDRHHTMAHYAAVKARIFRHCDTAVMNRDDAVVMAMGDGLTCTRMLSFGTDAPTQPQQYGLRSIDGIHVLTDSANRFELAETELHIFGLHNLSNALAALALAEAAGIERVDSLRALRAFGGLPHRCEFVRELDGVRYFNDSKGTNVGSTLAALNGLPAPIVWIGGGQGKGQAFAPLREALACKGRAAIVYGEDAARIEAEVFGALPIYRESDMGAALARAHTLARPHDQVLLSPACASFDQFRSYVDRGDQYRAMVGALA